MMTPLESRRYMAFMSIRIGAARPFVRGLTSGQPMFFVLTNSRAFRRKSSPLLVSRGDSTLRGHYPLETESLRQTLEAMLPLRYSGEILMPYFQEGGRVTIGDVHYVRTGSS